MIFFFNFPSFSFNEDTEKGILKIKRGGGGHFSICSMRIIKNGNFQIMRAIPLLPRIDTPPGLFEWSF